MPVSYKHRKNMKFSSSRRAKPTRRDFIPRSLTMSRPIMGGANSRIGRLPAALASSSTELKALDVPFFNVNLNTTAQFTCLNLIRTGSTFCNRVGRKIEMKSLRIAGNLFPLRTNQVADYVRIMVIYDRQANGAAPAIADLIQTVDQAAANTTSAFSGVNLNNRDRFIVLRDTRIVPSTNTVTAGAITTAGPIDPLTPLTNIDMFIKLPSLITQYKADSSPAVIGDIASGALWLVSFGTIASGSEGWSSLLESRLRYVDM